MDAKRKELVCITLGFFRILLMGMGFEHWEVGLVPPPPPPLQDPQSEHGIRFILPARGASHIIKSDTLHYLQDGSCCSTYNMYDTYTIYKSIQIDTYTIYNTISVHYLKNGTCTIS